MPQNGSFLSSTTFLVYWPVIANCIPFFSTIPFMFANVSFWRGVQEWSTEDTTTKVMVMLCVCAWHVYDCLCSCTGTARFLYRAYQSGNRQKFFFAQTATCARVVYILMPHCFPTKGCVEVNLLVEFFCGLSLFETLSFKERWEWKEQKWDQWRTKAVKQRMLIILPVTVISRVQILCTCSALAPTDSFNATQGRIPSGLHWPRPVEQGINTFPTPTPSWPC